jgi:formylglycine-generating enzyme required for sulfatase activity
VKLKQDLIAREAPLDAHNKQIVAQAQAYIQVELFDEAIQILNAIPLEYQTSSTLAISQTASAEKASVEAKKVHAAEVEKVAAASIEVESLEKLSRAPITNTIGMKLKEIPAGTFLMGSPADETGREVDEHQHKVTISKTFYIQTTEVTQEQWTAMMGTKPWKGGGCVVVDANYPATYVSWDDAVAYCEKLSAKEGKTYRLPTNAEWEYACRAGSQTTWSFGNDEKALGDYSWCEENTTLVGENYPHQVGLKQPNAFGLYDMHGNVWEWCHDYSGRDYYLDSPEKDPMGPTSGSSRVLRGGSWLDDRWWTRSAFRNGLDAGVRNGNVGFRLVRESD